MTVLGEALKQLRQEYVSAGKTSTFEALKVFLDPNNSIAPPSYDEVANRLQVTTSGVKTLIHGHDVCVIARDEHLSAIAAKGLTLRIAGADKTAIVRASNDPSRFGPQDYVFCTLKSHQAYTAGI